MRVSGIIWADRHLEPIRLQHREYGLNAPEAVPGLKISEPRHRAPVRLGRLVLGELREHSTVA